MALDELLGMPDFLVGNEKYEKLYDEMTARLREEASGLPMTTMMQILIERISTLYVLLRWRESENQWQGTTQQKDLNTQWLEHVKEFNRLLREGEDVLREELVNSMYSVVMESLRKIKDPEDRKRVNQQLATEFAKLGL